MEEKENKALDAFHKKLIREAGLEEPSMDFTIVVMDKIRKDARQSTVFLYTPLIPRYIWWLSAVVLVIFCGYVLLETGNLEFMGSSRFASEFLNMGTIVEILNDLNFPDTLVYGFLCLTIFVCLQTYLLTIHWNKRCSI